MWLTVEHSTWSKRRSSLLIVPECERIISAEIKSVGGESYVAVVVGFLDAVTEHLVVDESSTSTVVVVGHDVSAVPHIVGETALGCQDSGVVTHDLGHTDLPARHTGHGGNTEGNLGGIWVLDREVHWMFGMRKAMIWQVTYCAGQWGSHTGTWAPPWLRLRPPGRSPESRYCSHQRSAVPASHPQNQVWKEKVFIISKC